jgi:SAM-dependent methyltransferase
VPADDPAGAPTSSPGRDLRNRAYGEDYTPTPVDRFGVWLSGRMIRRAAGGFDGLRLGDVGCGYHATFARSVLDRVGHAVLLDVSLAPDLRAHPRVTAVEGRLPEALEKVADAGLDVVVCNSVLEHLWEPGETVRHLHRVTAPGGLAVVNVPSWRGKTFLELSAFRLGLSPADEMQDHKAYYDPRDLWPLLVRGGFRPAGIRCRRHKFTLNTFAVCRKEAD